MTSPSKKKKAELKSKQHNMYIIQLLNDNETNANEDHECNFNNTHIVQSV